ncbi:MAG TPA: SH3 domain-containing C40 family peptidase [Candidatus Krumholzibacteria bacterium]
MIPSIHDTITTLLRERGLDRRTCYTSVAALPPDGAVIEVLCSDAAIAGELQRRLAGAGVAAQVRALPAPGVPELMLVVSGVADVRREPSHPSELVSQIIFGDTVIPLRTDGDWVLARLDDGYIGWIRDWHLKPWTRQKRDEFASRSAHRIRPNHAEVLSAPEASAPPIAQLVVGTPVAAPEPPVKGWLAVELADGRRGHLRRAQIERTPHGRATPQRLARTGLRFAGVPYLWGGTTPNGFDCSGLMQRIFRLNGVILPRDSDMQARIGLDRLPADPAAAQPGDLLFFGRSADAITHVGLVLPDRTFLHAYGQVIVNSLDTGSERYSERLASIWRLTRSPLRTRRS